MPPSLNPWGAACGREAAKRWTPCAKKGGIEPSSTASATSGRLRSKERRYFNNHASQIRVGECASLPPQAKAMGPRCAEEVTARFDTLQPPSLAQNRRSTAFMGLPSSFAMPPPQKTLAACEKSDLLVRFSATVAHLAPWEGSTLRVIGKRAYYVAATPVIDEHDIERLQLEEQGDDRSVRIELSPAATKRFSEATAADVGGYLVLSFDGTETVPLVQSEITSNELTFDAGARKPSELCRTHP